MASKWLSSPLARLVFLTGGTVLLTLGISRDENEWLWIGGFLIALTIYLFYSSQKQLREKSWLMLEAIRNRDYSFRLPTHGFIGGERILQNALNEFGAMMGEQKQLMEQRERFYEQVLSGISSGIIVLDEHNVFITDAQAAYRFDSTTDELHLIEGSYALGNQGVTIESIISPNGMMAIDGHIYAGAGGFWSETKLVEFSKDSNQINRTLALGKGNLISGLCLLDDGTLIAATYTRGNNVTYLYYIDLESWDIAKETEIRTTISPDYFNTASSSIFSYKNNIYFPESETRISRLSADNGKIEPYIDIRKDAPNANGFDCMTIDAQNGKLYISTHSECFENVIPQSNVLIYDLNSDRTQATRCISDITHYATGIYPM